MTTDHRKFRLFPLQRRSMAAMLEWCFFYSRRHRPVLMLLRPGRNASASRASLSLVVSRRPALRVSMQRRDGRRRAGGEAGDAGRVARTNMLARLARGVSSCSSAVSVSLMRISQR